MSENSSFGNKQQDLSVSNLAVSNTLVSSVSVASKAVAGTVVANTIQALDIDVEALRIRGTLVDPNSGSGGGSGPTITVPGVATDILTSSGTGTSILAPGSQLSTTGVLNIVGNGSSSKIQFDNVDILKTDNKIGLSSSLLVGTSGSTLTSTGNTLIGCNASDTLTTGTGNVSIGAGSNVDATTSQATVIGFNAVTSIGSNGSIVIGAGSQVTQDNSGTKAIVVGNGTRINTLADSSGTIVMGSDAKYEATGLGAQGGVLIGNSAVMSGAKTNSSVVIGNGASDSGGGAGGSVVIGQQASTAFENCICLGRQAIATNVKQLVLSDIGVPITGTFVTPDLMINVKLAGSSTIYRLPLYATL